MKIRFSKSFLAGYIKAFDLYGVTKCWPDISMSKQRDFDALKEDWKNVGDCIRKETEHFDPAEYGSGDRSGGRSRIFQ